MGALLWVGLGGFLGAVARYVLGGVIAERVGAIFPWGTFVINVSGSLLLGLTVGLASHHGLPTVAATVIGVGVLGGYTTWSTYLWESVTLAETGAVSQAALNVFGSLAAGLAAAAAGFGLALL